MNHSGRRQAQLPPIDLSYLTEAERQHVAKVVVNDLKLRSLERERLVRFKNLLRKTEAIPLSIMDPKNRHCALCSSEFMMMVNPRRICANCAREVCNDCSARIESSNVESLLCALCIKQT
ncbi:hypothetical protein Ciccas_004290 [Cichlidogyrus casuarinus]|uniref:FYVE-type domain-containing protein n=1 Tax=Cichlidogyrus casuarinus TaxID=1844966 RepID=A0ABD2QCR2_9PLAT